MPRTSSDPARDESIAIGDVIANIPRDKLDELVAAGELEDYVERQLELEQGDPHAGALEDYQRDLASAIDLGIAEDIYTPPDVDAHYLDDDERDDGQALDRYLDEEAATADAVTRARDAARDAAAERDAEDAADGTRQPAGRDGDDRVVEDGASR